jgi:hypothetical protein
MEAKKQRSKEVRKIGQRHKESLLLCFLTSLFRFFSVAEKKGKKYDRI